MCHALFAMSQDVSAAYEVEFSSTLKRDFIRPGCKTLQGRSRPRVSESARERRPQMGDSLVMFAAYVDSPTGRRSHWFLSVRLVDSNNAYEFSQTMSLSQVT